MGGRLQQVEATFEELHPVLVKKCGVVNQLVLHIHEQMQHAGTATVISELRRKGICELFVLFVPPSRGCRKHVLKD